MKKILFFMGWLMSSSLYSQSELKVFQDWMTTAGTQHFFYRNVTRTDGSGNVYVAGATQTAAGDYDILLAKYNSSGVQQWIRQIDGTAHYQDFATSIQLDGSGSVYITGAITNDTVSRLTDLIVVKYNSGGTEQWRATYDGANLYDCGTDIYVTSGGSVVVVGSRYNASVNLDFISLAYNSSGVQQFATRYDHSSSMNDVPVRITKLGSSTYVSGAVQTGTGTYDWAEVKYNNSGVQQALKTSTGGTTGIEEVHAMVQDAGGNLYLAGITPTLSNGYDYDLIKLDSSLNIVWERTYDGTDHLNDIANGIQVSASGDVYVTGASRTTASGDDYLTLKYNSSGTLIWSRTFNDSLNGDDVASAVAIDNSGKIIVTGSALTDSLNNLNYYTIKYDTAGTVEWNIVFDGDKHLNDRATTIAIDTVGAIVVTGASETAAGVFEYATVKYVEKNIITPVDYNSEPPAGSFLYYENKGQLIATDTTLVQQIKYYTDNTYPALYFQDHEYSMVFAHIDTVAATPDTLHRIDVSFFQSNASAKTYPLEKGSEYLNYFLAHCPQGVTEIYGNQKLVTTNLYSNMDVVYSSNRYGLKYYFIVKPGGSPSSIKMEYTGASSFHLDGTTNVLTINSTVGSIAYDRPTVYQLNSSNVVVPVTGWTADWQTNGAGNKYKFNLGAYDSTKTLVIEVDMGNAAHAAAPSAIGNLEHSTYYGSTTNDFNNDIQTDNAGNVYTCGISQSAFFPTLNAYQSGYYGASDATLVKFNNAMKRIWGTYLGGTGNEEATSVDFGAGTVHVTGITSSSTSSISSAFPRPLSPVAGALNDYTYSGYNDIFVAKINSAGNALLWSTYFGGTGAERPNRLRFDGLGNFYIVGKGTAASPIKIKAGAYNQDSLGNGYIAKFNSADTLVWSALIPGTTQIEDFAANGAGENVFVADVYYTGYPIATPAAAYADNTLGGLSDGGITKLNSNDTIYWSTLYGGSYSDYAYGVAYNSSSDIFVTGHISGSTPGSTSWPYYNPGGTAFIDSTMGGATDAYFLKFDKNGRRKWASLYGGNLQEDEGYKIACDASDNIYFIGETHSTDFPLDTLAGCYMQASTYASTWSDGFITAFNPSLERIWSTYFSGAGTDLPYGIAIDQSSKLYVTGITDCLNIFPLADIGSGAWYRDSLNNGSYTSSYTDAYIARFDLTPMIIGINEPGTAGNTSLIVYPNPGSSNANLKITLDKQTDLKISVISILGQVVYQKQLQNKIGIVNENVDLSNMTNGVYFISVTTNTGRVSAKIIKE